MNAKKNQENQSKTSLANLSNDDQLKLVAQIVDELKTRNSRGGNLSKGSNGSNQPTSRTLRNRRRRRNAALKRQQLTSVLGGLRDDSIPRSATTSAVKTKTRELTGEEKRVKELAKSIFYPELGLVSRIPNAYAVPSAVSTWHYSMVFTPHTNGNYVLVFDPQNITSPSRLVFGLKGDQLTALGPMNGANVVIDNLITGTMYDQAVAGPYAADDGRVEALRVTAASMIIRCINPQADASSGMVALSYNPGKYYNTGGYFYNLSQEDIEKAAIKQGQVGGIFDTYKGVWMPRQPTSLDFAAPGAYSIGEFLAAFISGSTATTKFRADFYVNYEYLPGEALDDIVQVGTSDYTNEDWNKVVKSFNDKSLGKLSLSTIEPTNVVKYDMTTGKSGFFSTGSHPEWTNYSDF